MLIVSCPVGVMRHSVWGMAVVKPTSSSTRKRTKPLLAKAAVTAPPYPHESTADNPDDYFILRRLRLRREDEEALASGKVTPEELQLQNSIFPPEFFKNITIDLDAGYRMRYAKAKDKPGFLRRR